MGFFRRYRSEAAGQTEAVKLPEAAAPQAALPELQPIPLSAEQKAILEQPINPRVERILYQINAARAAAERLLAGRRIVHFPIGQRSERPDRKETAAII
jgi:hypothetical protein